ncbi:stage II sporulation protein M [uncultured Thermanaerothrix sp.]|uniref:stage II sporulation protein M n=1 Tax=uncultured Thermanaerothrix sp. TaxID=1195149 RepID=UPI0026188ACE|nr:stage II sporulation protein M [uncultured Thermanaerothrix sp.]
MQWPEALQPIWIIARREIRDQFRDWRILAPILFLTAFFPFLMNFFAQQMLDFVRRYGAELVGERMVPFLMLVVGFFPISISLVIALESFVGEKERGSIEPLLSAPLEDWQLYAGKLVSSMVLPLLAAFLGMGVYTLGLALNRVTLPPLEVVLQVFSLTFFHALVMVSGAVVASSQATSVRAANLLASFIVIPMALLIQGETAIMFWGRQNAILWWAVFGLLVLAILLVRVGLAHFQREELLGRELDTLDLAWGWRTFVRHFRGEARSMLSWYKEEIPRTLVEMRWTLLIAATLALVGLGLGVHLAQRFPLQLDLSEVQTNQRLSQWTTLWPMGSSYTFTTILGQNLRALFLGMILGSFSFGVLGVLPMLTTMGAVGFLTQALSNNGVPPFLFIVAAILPHGLLEVPALWLATTATLEIGLGMITPQRGKTFSEALLAGIARWFKIMLGMGIPLLVLAAAIETWITPQIVRYLLFQ